MRLAAVGIAGPTRLEHLDGDHFAGRLMLCLVDRAEGAGAQGAQYLVGAELGRFRVAGVVSVVGRIGPSRGGDSYVRFDWLSVAANSGRPAPASRLFSVYCERRVCRSLLVVSVSVTKVCHVVNSPGIDFTR